jgi:hypothetical protein
VKKTADELREIMEALGIMDFSVRIPMPSGDPKVNYGVWVKFRKVE